MTGPEIVESIIATHAVNAEQFFSRSRVAEAVSARTSAIRALKETGFNNAAIGRLIGKDVTSVRYWVKPERRAKQMARGLEYYHTYKP